MTSRTPQPSSATKGEIVRSARAAIERTGILGLRVAEVAADAGVSETLVYKYFGDRNGLLTEALTSIWHDLAEDHVQAAERLHLSLSDDELTPEVFASLKVRPQDPESRDRRWMRIQILAASLEIPELRERLAEEQRAIQRRYVAISEALRQRLPLTGFSVDARVEIMVTLAATIGWVLSDLLGDEGLTDEEALAFWTDFHRLIGYDDPRLSPRTTDEG